MNSIVVELYLLGSQHRVLLDSLNRRVTFESRDCAFGEFNASLHEKPWLVDLRQRNYDHFEGGKGRRLTRSP
jgi:hypothetical protein